MAKFNTLPDEDLDEIEKLLVINIWTVRSEERWKLTLDRRNFDFKTEKKIFLTVMCFLQEIVIFA